jgi:hypothetical protein
MSKEELKALKIDVTGKIMLTSWCGMHFEVMQVLHKVHVSLPLLNQLKLMCSTYCTIQVIDNVLKDHSASDQEVYNCTWGLLLLSVIFKSTRPNESDEEQRELERYIVPY